MNDIIRAAVEEKQAALAIQTAEFARQEAMYRAAKASEEFQEAQISRKEAELHCRWSQNGNRPSMRLYARLDRVERDGKIIYTATVHGLTVEGDTPEMAFDNFDHVWTQGEHRE